MFIMFTWEIDTKYHPVCEYIMGKNSTEIHDKTHYFDVYNSSYMYLYRLTYYNCPKHPQHTLNQWRILHYHELFCFLYTLLSLDFKFLWVEIFVSASLAMKLREYTRNTPIRRNPVSKFWKKIFLTVIFWIFEFFENCAILNAFNVSQYVL